jgi:transcriptional regulator with XRE-family HTH domain
MSQTELGDRIGVTSSQVQKYEKGVSRINAGRLQRISEALEVSITFFFDSQTSLPTRSEKSGVRGRADSRNVEIGRRVRSRRLECRLSQTELADRIGVTFLQVQKYEKGVIRIGAGRLQRISEALEIPITFFFDGQTSLPTRSEKSKARGRVDSSDAEVGRCVRRRRLERAMSQVELADRIGVTFRQVQEYEEGVVPVTAGRLQRIAEALDVPIARFFD